MAWIGLLSGFEVLSSVLDRGDSISVIPLSGMVSGAIFGISGTFEVLARSRGMVGSSGSRGSACGYGILQRTEKPICLKTKGSM